MDTATTPILQRKKLRPRALKELAPNHAGGAWQGETKPDLRPQLTHSGGTQGWCSGNLGHQRPATSKTQDRQGRKILERRASWVPEPQDAQDAGGKGSLPNLFKSRFPYL